jgi:uncharacterized protein YbjT (DUF2867 family)
MKKTALIIGATGLVGKNLVLKLMDDSDIEKIRIFVRSPTEFVSSKLEEIITDFDKISSYKDLLVGDVLFSCLGTTVKQAGSKAKQKLVDYNYQLEFAEIAKTNGVENYVLISATGADANSFIFYNKIKGELEEAIKKLHFEKTTILQPSVLNGPRNDNRIGEQFGAFVIDNLGALFGSLKKYRSISGKQVARAMIYFYKNPIEAPFSTYKLDELFVK